MKRKDLPDWLTNHLSYEEATRIEEVIKAAEAKTSAEIVPMIVRRSTMSATGRRIIFWIFVGLFGISSATWLIFVEHYDKTVLDGLLNYFDLWPTPGVYSFLSLMVEAFIAGAVFGATWVLSLLASDIDWLQRLVFPERDQSLMVEHRALSEFYSSDLRSTSGRTGILIFVSLLERRAVILGDEEIAKKCDNNVWKSTLETLVKAIGNGEMTRGFIAAITSMERILEKEFPVGNRAYSNELDDRLRIKD